METEFCIVLCTCPQKSIAEQIAHAAVSQELAACVSIIDKVESVYLWQGEVQQDNEVQLIFKTKRQLTDDLFKLVISFHPYDVPEWLILDVASGSEAYLNWVRDSLK
ncbi:divalent-cation tolerance protein CutA [Neptunicella sp. SCSIO 80796]|uniref:divalent-cation tolerance protein CutA n=1 Tax=Neptunicella plasticusilytica TaxID=3117012 RepID=UPI003A4E0A81